MKLKTALILVLFLAACKSKDNSKAVSIFIDPSDGNNIPQKHVEIILNGAKIADKTVAISKISTSVLVHCFTIDSLQRNDIAISVNNKVVHIDPSKYQAKCLDIFTSYNTDEKIKTSFHEAEKRSVLLTNRLLDFKKYFDSVRLRPVHDYDTILYGVQTNKCWCDSAVAKQ